MAISLTAQYDHTTNDRSLYGYSLRITVTAAQGMPAEIFVYQRGAAPAPAAGEQVQDNYICIADPVDLDEIPAVAPDMTQEIPYYRTSQVVLAFRDLEELQECEEFLKADIATLVRSMNAMTAFIPQETETYG